MSKTALLVIDVQKGNLIRLPNPTLYVPKVAHTITTARSSGVKIIHVTVSFRPGHPEIHPRNKSFGKAAAANLYVNGTDEVSVPAELVRSPCFIFNMS
jgi:nicotinamidase-related amidase